MVSWNADQHSRAAKLETVGLPVTHGEVRERMQQLRDADQQSRAANLETVGLPVTHGEVRERRQQLRDADQQSRAANLETVGLPVTHGEVRERRQQLRDADQHSRVANLETVGLPVTYGENIYDRLQKVAAIVQVPFKRDDISKAHRLRLFSKKHAHPPVIVQFVSPSIKESWLAAARTKRNLDARDISPFLQPSRVYINDHPTRFHKTLLGRARRLVREKRIHFARYFNGKVLIGPKEGDEAVRVLEMDDLDQFDHQGCGGMQY
ncbi:hypothetical protein J6590_096010 [Homalodisca vitripennis]|nr:hypothetical protein J6590_096010 [Homalodisca vitripennis]